MNSRQREALRLISLRSLKYLQSLLGSYIIQGTPDAKRAPSPQAFRHTEPSAPLKRPS